MRYFLSHSISVLHNLPTSSLKINVTLYIYTIEHYLYVSLLKNTFSIGSETFGRVRRFGCLDLRPNLRSSVNSVFGRSLPKTKFHDGSYRDCIICNVLKKLYSGTRIIQNTEKIARPVTLSSTKLQHIATTTNVIHPKDSPVKGAIHSI